MGANHGSLAPLPAVLAEVAEIAGIEAAMTLARARGGQTVFLPHQVEATHWLAELLGQDVAVCLCRHFRSNHVSKLLVPMGHFAFKADAVMAGLQEGYSTNEIAGRAGVHERTVRRHRSRFRGRARPSSSKDRSKC